MMRGKTVKLFELLVIAAVMLGFRALSHADGLGTIEGTILTKGGGAISGASVTIAGCTTRTVSTDGSGHFSAMNLPACKYTVTATATGFAAAGASVMLAAGASRSVHLSLVQIATAADPAKHDSLQAKNKRKQPDFAAERGDKNMPTEAEMPSPVAATPPPMMMKPSGYSAPRTRISGGQVLQQQQALEQDPDMNTEAYSRVDENPFMTTQQHPLSTFSADVDTASYANTRRFLKDGQLPPKDAVRLEEFINYFHYDLPAAPAGQPFSITTEVGASPWNTKYDIVRIGLKAPAIDDAKVPPRNLTFLIDVSGSMFSENKLPLLKRALLLLVDQLRPEDKVAMVVYAGNSGLVLPPTSGREKSTIRNALTALEAGGSTNGAAGIQLAYDTAQKNFVKGGINRVILCTDGDFNVGTTNEGDLTRLIEQKREKGVFLTVLGFGMGNLKDSTMEKLADRGNGNYAYIDAIEEARKVLVKEAGATLVTVAKDVKLQVEFNPSQVAGYRLVGYEKRLLKDEDFNDDKKDAGDIGAGHSVTALYEIIPAGQEVPGAKVDGLKYTKTSSTPSNSSELMTVKIRYKQPDGKTSKLLAQPVKSGVTALAQTTVDFRWAVAVAGFGMMLRESPNRGNLSWDQVEKLAEGSMGPDTEGYRKELVQLVKIAAKLHR
ncbi:MAG: von Willebrand factor type A domain-containing protein [Deltaproteobacteria bacterium]